MKPSLPPAVPADLPALAATAMKRAKFPFLATVGTDGQPRVRPVSPVRVDGFTVFIANLRRYGKTAEIAADSRVELCYLDEAHDQVRITARAEIVDEPDILAAIWEGNPLLRRYLGTLDNPELIVYRCLPERVRFMREWALEYDEVPIGCTGSAEGHH